MLRTMECRLVERVFIVVHGERPPTDEDWQVYLDAIEGARAWEAQVVYSLGGAPSVKQRQAAITKGAGVRERPAKTAIVSDSFIMRGITSFFGWVFPMRFKFFPLTDFDRALSFLELDEAQRSAVVSAVEEMKREVAPSRG